MQKKRIISGFQPTGRLTIGNYLGAIKPALKLQDSYELYIFVADLHSLTINPEPRELRENRKEIFETMLSLGFSSECKIFYQSDIPAHTYLTWILINETTLGELSRMTQFKDKSLKKKDNGSESIPTGLLVYPTLMAADILIYNSDLVVVGRDQKQHLELTRNIATRFNNRYGRTFVVPKPYILEEGSKIMSLQEPEKKMSKSDPKTEATIFLDDDPELAHKKIMRAKTDSEDKIYICEKKPGITNLINILALIRDVKPKEIEDQFKEKSYAQFKEVVAAEVRDLLRDMQERKKKLRDTHNRLNYQELVEKLRIETDNVVKIVRERVGID